MRGHEESGVNEKTIGGRRREREGRERTQAFLANDAESDNARTNYQLHGSLVSALRAFLLTGRLMR